MVANPVFRPRPHPPPSAPPGGVILFRHPAYNPRRNLLLSLPRADEDGAGGPMGIHHGTALLACQIVANNAFQGRLFTDNRGQDAVQVGSEEILTKDEYYFFADPNDPNLKYPIVPTFQDWAFPNQIPANWGPVMTPMSSATVKCCISDHEMGLKRAHIVPKEELVWFKGYLNMADIDEGTNRMNLRADIHRIYDAKVFAAVPKMSPNQVRKYVVHFLGNDAAQREARILYHNVPIDYASDTKPCVHLARFAWAIFPKLKLFLTQGCPRHLVRLDNQGVNQTEDVSGAELLGRYGGGGSQSASPMHPRKRS